MTLLRALPIWAALGLLLAALAAPRTEPSPEEQAFLEAIERMRQATNRLRDATFYFHREEWVGGAMTTPLRTFVKYRPPHDVYMSWPEGGPNAGREMLFRPGWNGDRMRVRPGGWVPIVNLNPHGSMAMRGSRHSVYNLGFRHLVGLVARDAERLQSDPARYPVTVRDEGRQQVFGEPARCFKAELPKAEHPEFYGYKVRLCLHERTGLPGTIQVWDDEDGAVRLIESYGYEQLQVNPGLTDADFEPGTYNL